MTGPSWAGAIRTVDGRDEVLVPCDTCGGPVYESCRRALRARGQFDCGLGCEPRPTTDVRVHWVPQGIVGGAEVVTAAEYVAIAGPLDPEFDWPVPVASRGGVALYLRPRPELSAAAWHRQLVADLTAGRSVSLGRLTVTGADGGGVTFTDPAGGSLTFRTEEDFEAALVEGLRLGAAQADPQGDEDDAGSDDADDQADSPAGDEPARPELDHLEAAAVTIAVVPRLGAPFAWWHEDRHLAVNASCAHDLPAVLEAAAQHIRGRLAG